MWLQGPHSQCCCVPEKTRERPKVTRLPVVEGVSMVTSTFHAPAVQQQTWQPPDQDPASVTFQLLLEVEKNHMRKERKYVV